MVSGNAHYLFYAANRDDVVVVRIEFRFSEGDYQVQAEAINDASTWSSSPWVTITDGPHALEIDWQAASAAGANNGGLAFWVDGVQQANFTNIDNDTRRVDYVQWGAVAGIDTGTRGTYFFGAFESRRESYFGLTNVALQPPALPVETVTVSTFPAAVPTDGFHTGWVTVTVADVWGLPVAGVPVTLTLQPDYDTNPIFINNAITFTVAQPQFIGETNAAGVVPVAVSAQKAGQRHIEALAGEEAIAGSAIITFVPGPVSAQNSLVVANQLSAMANGFTLVPPEYGLCQ